MGTLKLRKHVFDAIRRELLNTDRNRTQADIAADYQVSTTMVSVVNNARTWQNYKAGIQGKTPLRHRVTLAKPSKVQQAEKAGLKPHDREDRATKKLDSDLKELEKAPTREEFDRLCRRVDLQGRQLSYIARIPVLGNIIRKQLQQASADHYRANLGSK